MIERAVILSGRTIEPGLLNLELPKEPMAPAEGLLRETERETISKVLADVGGNRKKAAKALGISIRTLQYRIREYGL